MMLRLQDFVEFSNDLILEMRTSLPEKTLKDSKSLVPVYKSMHDNKVILGLSEPILKRTSLSP